METAISDISTEAMAETISSLIIGGDSQIGCALESGLRGAGDRVVVTTRHADTLAADRVFLDLTKFRSQGVPQADVAFVCAGATSLCDCHEHPASARRVNVDGTCNLAETLLRHGTFVVFVSTNLVFDGSTTCIRADAERRPTTVYGSQKAEAERRLLQLGDRIAVVRLAKVLPRHFPLFHSWHQQLQSGRSIHAFEDLNIAPIPLHFAAELILRIGRERLPGIWQASASEEISYYEIAQRLADRFNLNRQLVRGVSAESFEPLNGVVPKHSTLDSDRLRAELGLSVPDAWSTVDSTLAHTIDRNSDE